MECQVKSAPARHQAVLVRRQPKSSGNSFPSHLDKVFEREERCQSDGSIRKHSWGTHPETSWTHPVFPPTANSVSLRKRKEHPANSGPWIGSYASDPSLPTLPSPVFDPCNRSSSISSNSSSCSSSSSSSSSNSGGTGTGSSSNNGGSSSSSSSSCSSSSSSSSGSGNSSSSTSSSSHHQTDLGN